MSTPSLSPINTIPPKFFASSRDGYRAARSTISAGEFVKIISMVIAVLLIIAGAMMFLDGGELIREEGLAAMLSALVFGFGGYCFGTALQALGHILRSTIDSSINSFPFGDILAKTELMGLMNQSAGDQAPQ